MSGLHPRVKWSLAASLLLLALPLFAASRGNPKTDAHASAPASVTIVGTFQTENGCGNWNPACVATRLVYDATDGVWQGTFAVPAGTTEYKAALNGNWTESYPGSNRSFTSAGATSVKFYYSHATHWVVSNADESVVIATAAGTFQEELGCSGDWQPACLQSWLQDPEGDGVEQRDRKSVVSRR
jgi:hypothetical protein